MAKSVSPSITAGQIGKFYDLLVAGLRKSGLPSEPTQRVLEIQGAALVDEFVTSVRKRVDAISEMIVRVVRNIDRTRLPQNVLDATGRKQYIDQDVLKTAPRGKGGKAAVFFFKMKRWSSPAEVAKAYEQHGLTSDLDAQAKVNEDDPSFADKYPNACQWQDADGRWCYATFGRWDGERGVRVDRSSIVWLDGWWFGGVRNSFHKLRMGKYLRIYEFVDS